GRCESTSHVGMKSARLRGVRGRPGRTAICRNHAFPIGVGILTWVDGESIRTYRWIRIWSYDQGVSSACSYGRRTAERYGIIDRSAVRKSRDRSASKVWTCRQTTARCSHRHCEVWGCPSAATAEEINVRFYQLSRKAGSECLTYPTRRGKAKPTCTQRGVRLIKDSRRREDYTTGARC